MVSIYPHWRGSGWYFPQLVVRGENLLAANNVAENVLECTRMYEDVGECRRMYAEKSWRVIMSPNDRVSTTWWRQTRPGTHQLLPEQKSWKICHQERNQSLCHKKKESNISQTRSNTNLDNVSPNDSTSHTSFTFAVPALLSPIEVPDKWQVKH